MEETVEYGANATSPKRRITVSVLRDLGVMLNRGETGDHHAAALVELVIDAIERQYEAELVVVAREWRIHREEGE